MTTIPVPAPPLSPPRYSLLNTVTTLSGEAWPPGWEDQITWEPECIDPEAAAVRDDCDGAGGQEGAVNVPEDRPVISAVRLSATDTCSTMGANARDWQGRARRLLAATESAQLARQIWSGDATGADDPSPALVDAGRIEWIPGSDRAALVENVALLEAEASVRVAGRPWLHMAPRTFHRYLSAAGAAVQVQGGIATTVYGSVLVTDAGYSGNPGLGTDDEDGLIVATGPMYVRLGDVEVLGDDASGFDRTVNTRRVTAQRYATWLFEGCEWAAVLTSPPTTGPA